MIKQFIGLLLALWMALGSSVYAANTATAQTGLPIHGPWDGLVIPVVVSIDTVDTDLDIRDPAAGNMACIVGAIWSEGSATNVTFKSEGTTYAVPELAGSQGAWSRITMEPIFCTQPGEDLTIQASVAISNMLFFIVETERIRLKGWF